MVGQETLEAELYGSLGVWEAHAWCMDQLSIEIKSRSQSAQSTEPAPALEVTLAGMGVYD